VKVKLSFFKNFGGRLRLSILQVLLVSSAFLVSLCWISHALHTGSQPGVAVGQQDSEQTPLPAKALDSIKPTFSANDQALSPDAPDNGNPITDWAYDQVLPEIAYSSFTNTFMIVWEDHIYAAGSDWDILARLVGLDGSLVGGATNITSASTMKQLAPDLTYNPNNHEILVVFEHEYSVSDHDIYARRLDSNGSPIGEWIPISTSIEWDVNPAVAYNSYRNEYLIVWERRIGEPEFGQFDIYAQRIAANGSTVGSLIALETGTANQRFPALAYNSTNDEYLIVWQDLSSGNWDIMGRRLSGSGSLIGSKLTIEAPGHHQTHPDIAYNPAANEYLVVWEDQIGGSSSDWDIKCWRLNGSGANLTWHLIASSGSLRRMNPSLTYHAAGNEYIVAYEYEYSVSDIDVYYSRIRADGTLLQVDAAQSSATVIEAHPAIAASTNGWHFMIAWEDWRNAGTSAIDLYGQVNQVRAFSGYVWNGTVGNRSAPLAGVTVSLYCSNDSGSPGVWVESALTNAAGYYRLIARAPCEFYSLLETTPEGYISAGAVAAAGGFVITSDWIQFIGLPASNPSSENEFWDYLPPTLIATTTRTSTPTNPPTNTATQLSTSTPTRTNTPTNPPTNTATLLPTSTATRTNTPTNIPAATPTNTVTQTNTPILMATGTPTKTATQPPTSTATHTNTSVNTPTATATPTSTFIVPSDTVEPPLPLPDLVITDLWHEGGAICYQARNLGQAPASEGHQAVLFIDGVYHSSSTVGALLQPGQRWNGCFAAVWVCSPAQDELYLSADNSNQIAESDENNNARQETWRCDTTAPQISAGPYVTNLTPTSARIIWTTNEASASRVDYGRLARAYPLQVSDSALVISHSLLLSNLEPYSAYHFRVRSIDAAGNEVVSTDMVFQTPPEPDVVLPMIELQANTVVTRTTTMTATANDNVGISRVTFKLDGDLIYTAYSPPYRLQLDTTRLTNGNHTIEAVAYDHAGNEILIQKDIQVANLYDSSLPSVNITAPSAWQTLMGKATVKATLGDDTGLTYAYFYVDGSPTAFMTIPGNPKSYNLTLDWDTQTASNASHRLGLIVYDKEGKGAMDTVDITVNNPPPPPPPRLIVTSHQANRLYNWFLVTMTVQNVGGSAAREVNIREALKYFQPISKQYGNPATVTYTASYIPSTNYWFMTIEDKVELAVGASRTYSYWAIPVLENPAPPIPEIGKQISFYYQSPQGKPYTEVISLPILTVSDGDLLLKAYYRAVGEADMLIVTNPKNLYFQYGAYPYTKTDLILSRMAELAFIRNGVLAFMTDSDLVNRLQLRLLLNPQGASWGILGDSWAQRLHPNFSKPLGGSLLIVGETEVFGAWYDSSLDGSMGFKGVHFSDHPFADVNLSDPRPDLLVGRLIGDSADALLKQLETAIGVAYQRSGFSFAREDAFLFSDEGWGSFIKDIQNIAAVIQPEFDVTISHWKDYSVVADFSRSIQNVDAIASGDILGSSLDEIILADASDDKIYFYDKDGILQGSFSCSFDNDDRLAVGDILGDFRPEILVGDASSRQVRVYNSAGALQLSFDGYFGKGDNLAVGNVLNQAKSQVLVAKAYGVFGLIYTFRITGAPGSYAAIFTQAIPSSYYWFDGFAAGNLTDGNEDEFVIASSLNDKLEVYRPALGAWDTYTTSLQSGQNIAIGSVIPGFGYEAVALVDPSTRILIFRKDGINWSKSDIPCAWFGLHPCQLTYADGIAVGNVGLFNGSGMSEVILASQFGKVLSFDVNQWESRLNAAFPLQVPGNDLLIYSGHGGTAGWGQRGGISSGIFPINFNAHNPFVLSMACLTGNYQECLCFGKGDIGNDNHCPCSNATFEHNNIAEKVMASGAGIFIGSTEVSDGYPNRELSKKLFMYWTPGKSIAKAFTEIERSVWTGNAQDRWWFWVWEYNLYGDPKFGAVPAGSGQAAPLFPSNPLGGDTLQVDIPAFTVTENLYPPGLDLAEIPGGQMWLGGGEPRVPFYSVTYDYPFGKRVQQVRLVARSDPQYAYDLDLPANPLTVTRSNDSPQIPTPGDGWFPNRDFTWETSNNPDGSQSLILILFPFDYNVQTGEARFYNQYLFDVITVASPVQILSITPDQLIYPPGASVNAVIELTNTTPATDIIASAIIRREGEMVMTAALPMQTLKELSGQAGFSLTWESGGTASGSYQVEVSLFDLQGNLLDRMAQSFELGAMIGELSNLQVTPLVFQPGENLHLSVQVHNPASVPLTGTLQLQVIDSADQIVRSDASPVNNLPAHTSLAIDHILDTSVMPPGDYKILEYLTYESSSSQPLIAWVSTYRRLYLPVTLR